MVHFIVWFIVPAIAGFLASKRFNKSGSGLPMDIALGIIGGFVSGSIVYRVPAVDGLAGHSGFAGAIIELIVAILGAMLVIWLYERAVALEWRPSGERPDWEESLPAARPERRLQL